MLMRTVPLLLTLLLSLTLGGQAQHMAPAALPAAATTALRDSLEAARAYRHHVWRDTSPVNGDGSVTAYIEISLGDRRKWEFDMATHARAIDRMIPEEIGGYPINYGFVPQTVSYDGDPFDALVLGPALPGGHLVRGIPVGLMLMEDEKGVDSKIVLSPMTPEGNARYTLTEPIRRTLESYFREYKRYDPGAFSRVPGWGSAAEGLALLRLTHTFFLECRGHAGAACLPAPSGRPRQ
jgi:inorganic pyrophosphatase